MKKNMKKNTNYYKLMERLSDISLQLQEITTNEMDVIPDNIFWKRMALQEERIEIIRKLEKYG